MALTHGSGRGRRQRMESRAMNIRRGRLLWVLRASIPFSKINRDSESLQFIIKARFADLQNLSRLLLIPGGVVQNLHDMTLLHIVKAIETSLFRWTGLHVRTLGGRLLDFCGKVLETYDSITSGEGILNCALQFSDISRPRVGYEGMHGLGSNPSPPKLLMAGIFIEKIMGTPTYWGWHRSIKSCEHVPIPALLKRL
jgi:hypothetical protein